MTVMDNDVKNLFQRAGKTVAGYQEINRQQENEEARQRWPLLRDIRLEMTPDQLPPDEPVETNKLPLFGGMTMPELSRRPETTNVPEKVSVENDKLLLTAADQQKSVQAIQPERGSDGTELFFTKQINGRQSTGDADRLFSAILGKTEQTAERGNRNALQGSGETSKELPVSDVFRRLSQGAAKPLTQAPAPSFFRKIFGS